MKAHRKNFFPLTLAVLVLNLSVTQLAQADSWVINAPLNTARYAHTATLLPNGKLLVAGGYGRSGITNTAELYDPATGSWTATGSMIAKREGHTATLLQNGKVLVAGGSGGGPLSTAELYDPVSGKWTGTGNLTTFRIFHTATLLPNGKVLVTGGGIVSPLSSAEVYDPAIGTWTATGSMSARRKSHTATLLPNGQVLVAGGTTVTSITNSSELYDPAAGAWTTISNQMTARRFGHTATLLPDGQVFVVGGSSTSDGSDPLPSAELYNPASGIWIATSSSVDPHVFQTATLLPNGQVLVVGGMSSFLSNIGLQMYDPVTGKWIQSALYVYLPIRFFHTATLLPSGQVLLTGGSQDSSYYNSSSYLSNTDVYNPTNGTEKVAGDLNTVRTYHTATLLPNGQVLIAGGQDGTSSRLNSAELYDPASGTNRVTSSMQVARSLHSATLLCNGQVLVVGGQNSTGYLASAELYDPVMGTWKLTGSTHAPRMSHRATLLTNGKVLVTCGYVFLPNSGAELYDPATETWTVTGLPKISRLYHSATLLSNGKVLIAGGQSNGRPTAAELYDPVTATWTFTGTSNTTRYNHTATLLPNGKVLVTGGQNYYYSAELYDPVSETWAPTNGSGRPYGFTATLLPNGQVAVIGASPYVDLYDPASGTWTWTRIGLLTARQYHTATLLPDGKVFIAGGGTASTELYDPGLDITNSWQPQISAVTSPLNLGGALVITGSQFRGISEASGGNSQDSSTDYPLVQLRRLDNEQTVFLLTTNWSTNSFTSLPVLNFPPGFALATVFVNGIQSTSSIVNVSVPVPIAATLMDSQKLTNGFWFAFTNNVGALLGVLATTNLSLPLTNWTALGRAAEISPGQFQTTDPQATNIATRFYRVFAP